MIELYLKRLGGAVLGAGLVFALAVTPSSASEKFQIALEINEELSKCDDACKAFEEFYEKQENNSSPNSTSVPLEIDESITSYRDLMAEIEKSRPVSTEFGVHPGNAHDIAIDFDGTVWLIGLDKVPGGYSIWYRTLKDTKWNRVAGGATRIAIAGRRVFVINDRGAVFQWDGGKWQDRGNPGAIDIGASNAAIYVAGGKRVAGGHEILQWKGGTHWKTWPGGARRIDVDAVGDPWIVNDKGFIFARKNGQWRQFGGQGLDVAVNAPGAPVVIDMHEKLYMFDSGRKRWVGTKRAGLAVSISPHQRIWHVGARNEIYWQK